MVQDHALFESRFDGRENSCPHGVSRGSSPVAGAVPGPAWTSPHGWPANQLTQWGGRQGQDEGTDQLRPVRADRTPGGPIASWPGTHAPAQQKDRDDRADRDSPPPTGPLLAYTRRGRAAARVSSLRTGGSLGRGPLCRTARGCMRKRARDPQVGSSPRGKLLLQRATNI
jgi:hypothetical protein